MPPLPKEAVAEVPVILTLSEQRESKGKDPPFNALKREILRPAQAGLRMTMRLRKQPEGLGEGGPAIINPLDKCPWRW